MVERENFSLFIVFLSFILGELESKIKVLQIWAIFAFLVFQYQFGKIENEIFC